MSSGRFDDLLAQLREEFDQLNTENAKLRDALSVLTRSSCDNVNFERQTCFRGSIPQVHGAGQLAQVSFAKDVNISLVEQDSNPTIPDSPVPCSTPSMGTLPDYFTATCSQASIYVLASLWDREFIDTASWKGGTIIDKRVTLGLQACVVDDDPHFDDVQDASVGDLVHWANEEDDDMLQLVEKPESYGKIFVDAVSNPNSTLRLAWDVMGLALIGYDMINVPFQVGFSPTDDFWRFMDNVTLLFWTFDMIQAFFVKYYEKGELVTDCCKILRHYLRTWFIVDVLVVGPDWFFILASGGDSGLGFNRILKSARAIRVVRLLRLLKLQRILAAILDLIDSEYMFIIFMLARLVFFIVLLSHIIGCGWHWVGVWTDEHGERSWIDNSGQSSVKSREIGWKYATSLHWSLTQFTPASMDVSARNIVERVYSILVLLFSLLAFSSIIGSISSSMLALRQMSGETDKQFWLLRRYMKQHQVRPETKGRIVRYLEYQMASKEDKVPKSKITILQHLSDPLKDLLSYEMIQQFFLLHPFFFHLETHMKPVMTHLCSEAVRSAGLASDDQVFSAGQEATRMYFLKSGEVEYKLPNNQRLEPRLRPKAWIVEPALWTNWRHRGDLVVMHPAEFLCIEPKPFAKCMSVHPRPWEFTKNYAKSFIEYINRLDPDTVTDVFRGGFYKKNTKGLDLAAFARSSSSLAAILGESENPTAEEMGKRKSSGEEPHSDAQQNSRQDECCAKRNSLAL